MIKCSMIRFLDILFSGFAILILSPLFVVISILLRFTGEGEVLYFQKRVGLNKDEFDLIKFVTMVKNSSSIGTGTITIKNDPRILPVGSFLRKTKINELPQLFNVLKGDMSVIGPRPQTNRCFQAFSEEAQDKISLSSPGLSGIGSVVFRGEENMMNKAKDADYLYDNIIMPYKGLLEIWYVENRNIKTYFSLIFCTLWVIIFSKSKIYFKLFSNLPPVPDQLKELL